MKTCTPTGPLWIRFDTPELKSSLTLANVIVQEYRSNADRDRVVIGTSTRLQVVS